MKLQRADLTRITEIARQEMRDTVPYKMEGHDEHLARCWLAAITAVLNITVELPVYPNNFIDPEE